MTRYCGVNCSKCGRWVGKDGFMDVYNDEYNGYALELGSPLCKKCLDGDMKYREYCYTSSAILMDIVELRTLPKNVKKMYSEGEVWISRNREWNGYSKICRIDSDITFGTGVKSIAEFSDFTSEQINGFVAHVSEEQ